MINKYDYVFFKYISLHYDNLFLSKIVNKHERGMTLLERRHLLDFLEGFKKPKNVRGILLVYVIFKRLRKNTHIDELGKDLVEKLTLNNEKKLLTYYTELVRVLKQLDIPPLEINPQVVENIKYYMG